MVSNEGGALLSSSKTADSHLSVQLHPIVILTISDYITRHGLRRQTTPMVGAVLGTQNGRTITMEQAFECATESNNKGETVMNGGWFHERLQQYKDVHKAPALDLVGWFTMASPSGPDSHHLAIQNQMLETYNESALLLVFQPESLTNGAPKGGKLPLTIYESIYEAAPDDEDNAMKEPGEGPSLVLRFKELPYSVETAEAEMIGVDFVAKGSANAAPLSSETSKSDANTTSKSKGKGKAQESTRKEDVSDTPILTPEEEDLIAGLNSKANAIRMLQQRISLLKSYLDSMPPCYLNDPSITTVEQHPQISHTILRSINSLLARLPLLAPSTPMLSTSSLEQEGPEMSAYSQESNSEAADVTLVSLLGSLGSALRSAQTMGKKVSIVDSAKAAAAKKSMGGPLPGKGMRSFQESTSRLDDVSPPSSQDLHRSNGM
ncbi:MAG: hypothetical protein M1828_000963 [Chrysothrix sp. TS-e1954]|nr:MAG: hypothetical protein M1828_000963 [Chrysothrix sp. TS-e1954]